jgi:hypothetical protein
MFVIVNTRRNWNPLHAHAVHTKHYGSVVRTPNFALMRFWVQLSAADEISFIPSQVSYIFRVSIADGRKLKMDKGEMTS